MSMIVVSARDLHDACDAASISATISGRSCWKHWSQCDQVIKFSRARTAFSFQPSRGEGGEKDTAGAIVLRVLRQQGIGHFPSESR